MTSKLKQEVLPTPTPLPLSSRKLPVEMPLKRFQCKALFGTPKVWWVSKLLTISVTQKNVADLVCQEEVSLRSRQIWKAGIKPTISGWQSLAKISQFNQMYDFSGYSQYANAVVQHQYSASMPFINHLWLYSTLTYYRNYVSRCLQYSRSEWNLPFPEVQHSPWKVTFWIGKYCCLRSTIFQELC